MKKGIKEKDIRDFTKAASKLDEIIKRIRVYNAEANFYLAMDEFCLMCGPSHDCITTHKLPDNVVESVIISGSSGGDW